MKGTEKLLKGYRRFLDGYYRDNKDYLNKLAGEGQSPKIAMVSCCDSRVDPAIIMDCEPGDLFVVRNVANLVPRCQDGSGFEATSAALEFAVKGLGVESVIVLGHAQCGGIKALMDKTGESEPDSFISTWMGQLDDVRKRIIGNKHYTNQQERYEACEQMSIVQSLENLSSFPWIRSRVDQGRLTLQGWYYDINSAELFSLQKNSREFHKII